jgi:hypothetical protein
MENSATDTRNDLTMTNPVSDPVINFGYFTFYGPIVFYIIKMTLDSTDGWDLTSYIQLPSEEFVAAGAVQASHLGQAYVAATGAAITEVIMKDPANSKRLGFAGPYVNNTGADQVVFLQGWYFRN